MSKLCSVACLTQVSNSPLVGFFVLHNLKLQCNLIFKKFTIFILYLDNRDLNLSNINVKCIWFIYTKFRFMSKDTLLGLKNVPILACVVRGNWNYDDIDNIEFKVQSIGCVRDLSLYPRSLKKWVTFSCSSFL